MSPSKFRVRVRFQPQVGFLEQRTVLSALSTLTALRASAASTLPGQPITLTATVSDFPPGGATPSGGTVTLGDQYGSIASVPLINGVATFTTSSLAADTYTFTALYGGAADFGPSATGTIVTAAVNGTGANLVKAQTVGKITPDAPVKVAPAPDALGVVVDSAGDLFIADEPNNVVREIVKATGQNIIVAGNGTLGYSGDNGPATAAELNAPLGLAVDSTGNLFIADTGNNVIREVVKATGNIITFAGNGTAGYSGDNGPATDAELQAIRGIAVDSAGDLLIADGLADVIREVDRSTGNIITTIAGNGTQGSTGYNGPATIAALEVPADVAVDSAGNVFISDRGNNYILEVEKATGDIFVVAGNGTPGYSGDNGPATDAELNAPIGVAVDAVGDLFIADGNNNVISEVVKATGDIITVAGTGSAGYSGDGRPAMYAELEGLTGVAVDSVGNLYIADGIDNVVRQTTPAVVVAIRADATLTALRASAASTLPGRPITLIATVSDLTAGGVTPTGGMVTFSDQNGPIASEPLNNGVATLTTSNLALGTYTVTASYGGTLDFAPSATGTIVTAAGNGNAGYAGDNGPATAAELFTPTDSAVDSAGDVFIADSGNNVIREVVKATGNIITVAGNGTEGYSGDSGPATAAELNSPFGVAVDSAGDLFIADSGNNVIREVVKATGNIITIAGNGTEGYSGDNGPATAAELNSPSGVTVDSAGDLFIADSGNNVIREVVKATGVMISNKMIPEVVKPPGAIITVAGNGTTGYSGDGRPATDAELNAPSGVAVDSVGDLFIADGGNNVIREVVKATGTIVTVAGNGTAGYSGDNGPATDAELNAPIDVAVDSVGDLFIADGNNNVIREAVKATGNIITVAGNGTAGYSGDNGPASNAELFAPSGVAVDSAGDLFIADSYNNAIRRTMPAVIVAIRADTTLTALRVSAVSTLNGYPITFTATVSDLTPGGGTPTGGMVTFRDQKGTIASEPLNDGVATLTTSSLALGTYTVTASYGGTLDFAPSTTGTIVTAAGNGNAGYASDSGPATAAKLATPTDVAVDSAGDLFIADAGNHVVREVVKATGDIITVAGNGTAGYSGDNGPATAAELNFPSGVAVDSAGDLFIADGNNNVIREVVKATGDIITVAGNGTAGYSGDNGPATVAELNSPSGVTVDSAGDLFVADYGNNVIREVVKATGDIITVAGNGTAGYSGDHGPATAAELNGPENICVDSAGDLFIADGNNNVIREVVKATGDIITVTGNGTAGHSGDTGPATAAELDFPAGVALDSAGDLFIADAGNHVVREVVKATGDIITVAGNGTAGYSGDTGPATAAELNSPSGVAVDSAGNLFISDFNTNVVRQMTPPVTVTITPPPPQVVSEGLLTVKVVTHKDKRVITTSKFGGFQLRFNEALNPVGAQNTANYHLTQTIKQGRKTIEKPVSFNLAYIASTHTVDVEISGKVPLFKEGGLLTLTASGITDLAGDTLVGTTVFKILADVKGITV